METMHAAGRRNLPPVPRPTAESLAERTIQLRRTDDPETVVPGTAAPETAAREMAAPDAAPEPADEASDAAPDEAPDEAPGDAADHAADGANDDAPGGADDDADDDLADDDLADDDLADDDLADDDLADDDLADDDTAILPPAVETHCPEPEVLAVADEPELALDEDDPAQGFVSQLRAAAGAFASAAGAKSAVVREAVPPARHRRSRCRVVLRYADGAEADLTFLGSVGRPGSPAWMGFDQQIEQWLGEGQHRASEWLVDDQEASDGVAVDVPAWLAAAG